MTTAVLKLHAKVQKEIQSTVDSIDFPTINWKLVSLFAFAACLALVLFYVWQINSLTKGYYLINRYEKQLNSISRENKNLQVGFAESSFWGQANEKILALNFQKATGVTYIQIPDTSVAVNKK